ncbi:ATP-binding protein [uncultured Anaerococcus sp.]|uniref:ATP-binding protein n=1 Tax=uncultured Anaerococcus sp. TaxID=293428 RepID=UPI002889BB17|nr:ATP-binding protein [uncultured Anaerococcus sp.]
MEIIRAVINSDLKDIKKFRDKFIDMLEARLYEENQIFRLRLILDELTANSYKHGNKKDKSRLIDISVLFDDAYLLIKVKDQGQGIKSTKEVEKFSESGRGIDLVKKLSDEVIIEKSTIACLIRNS